MNDILSTICLLIGAGFIFLAALGVLRMPELYMRIHSSTKAGTLGLGFMLLGAAIHFQELSIIIRALATFAFIVLTAPVAAHVIGRAGYHSGVPLWGGTVVDEMKAEDKTK
ncbi:MAG: monovalent cation/H(+) antiporter subunit G [Bdellovibrionales bacterium]|nr:monovalent cation/H(+) antiporter subunit G [Bdellovibrionales bacterium]